MAKSTAQEEKDTRIKARIMEQAREAASGTVPFGYDDMDDWHETTISFYKRLFKDEEFASEFAIVCATIESEPDPVLDFVKEYTGDFEFLNSLKQQVASGRKLSPKQRAGAEKCMKRQPQSKSPRGSGPTITEDGIYKTDDDIIYKVQRAVHGSSRLYAKRLVLTEDHTSFEYEQGAVWKLRPEQKLSLEQAREYGTLYGVCVVCGKMLTDEKSIAAGIGPICAGKGWW